MVSVSLSTMVLLMTERAFNFFTLKIHEYGETKNG
jgi:hypothetical protein